MKIYFLVLIVIFSAIAMFGFILPYAISSKHNELIFGSIILTAIYPLFVIYLTKPLFKKQDSLK